MSEREREGLIFPHHITICSYMDNKEGINVGKLQHIVT